MAARLARDVQPWISNGRWFDSRLAKIFWDIESNVHLSFMTDSKESYLLYG